MKNKLFLLIAFALLGSTNTPAMELKKVAAGALGIGSIFAGKYITYQAHKSADDAFYTFTRAESLSNQGQLIQDQFFPGQTNLNNAIVLKNLKEIYLAQKTMIPFKSALAGALITGSLSIAALTLLSKKPAEYIAPATKAIIGGAILGFVGNMPADGSIRMSPPWIEIASTLTGFGLLAWAGNDIFGFIQ
jgi:hypothetical protein